MYKCLSSHLASESLAFYRLGWKVDCLGCIYTQQGEYVNVICINMKHEQKSNNDFSAQLCQCELIKGKLRREPSSVCSLHSPL